MTQQRPDGTVINLPTDVMVFDPEEKAHRAYKLKQSGASWAEVAEQIGYAKDTIAIQEVKRYLQRAGLEMSRERRLEALQLSIDRLESLLSSVWGMAQVGDIKAVDAAVRIIGQQAKLLGLEELYQEVSPLSKRTIVVSGNTEEYVSALKELAGGS